MPPLVKSARSHALNPLRYARWRRLRHAAWGVGLVFVFPAGSLAESPNGVHPSADSFNTQHGAPHPAIDKHRISIALCGSLDMRDETEPCLQASGGETAGSQTVWPALTVLVGVCGTLASAASTVFAAIAARSAQRSAKAAEDVIRLAYRPRLRVRNIVMNDGRNPGGQLHGQFYISNVGSSEAFISESHCEVLDYANGLPMERPYEGKEANGWAFRHHLPPGGSTPHPFSSDHPFPGWSAGSPLYVMGWIEYTDVGHGQGVRRRTAFCRRLEERNGSHRFYAVDDPDYEHEE